MNASFEAPPAAAPEVFETEAPRGRAPEKQRLVSLDAFRGAIMLLMASSALGIPQAAEHYPESRFWEFLAHQTEHVAWAGCALWDLIQPAFMFMVGVALPWSVANRRARGEPFGRIFGHAVWRSAALIALAVFLTSSWSSRTEWIFTNVLAQIGLGYIFLFLLAFARPRTQWIAAGTILFLYWLAFALHPLPPAGLDWKSMGVPENWPHLAGFEAHWEKNFNFAATFDRWFLNLFPRESVFVGRPGGYQTLNFIPSLATMIFGLLAGQLLKSDLPAAAKLKRLVAAGIAGVILGKAIDLFGLCPIVKRIWTPSWAIFSAGVVTLLLAGFFAVVECRGHKRWAFPLVVAGLNPITLYCLWQLLPGWVRGRIRAHFGQDIFAAFGEPFAPMLERGAILFLFWLVLYWMYRRKIFLRI